MLAPHVKARQDPIPKFVKMEGYARHLESAGVLIPPGLVRVIYVAHLPSKYMIVTNLLKPTLNISTVLTSDNHPVPSGRRRTRIRHNFRRVQAKTVAARAVLGKVGVIGKEVEKETKHQAFRGE